MTTERGSDPRDYALVAFGGGGPLHAAAVARELGIGRILVPRHPYTRALLSAIPAINTNERTERVRLTGEPMSPIDPSPHLCRFYSRCPQREERCRVEMPMLTPYPGGIEAACHFPSEKRENIGTQTTVS